MKSDEPSAALRFRIDSDSTTEVMGVADCAQNLAYFRVRKIRLGKVLIDVFEALARSAVEEAKESREVFVGQEPDDTDGDKQPTAGGARHGRNERRQLLKGFGGVLDVLGKGHRGLEWKSWWLDLQTKAFRGWLCAAGTPKCPRTRSMKRDPDQAEPGPVA